MARSSRHKSSKHSSREARGYSDSERDSSMREKQVKESSSGEKRKSIDVAKESIGSGNVEYIDEYSRPSSSSLSKKRKEKVEDDRWTGGDNNEHEVLKGEAKEAKILSELKRSRRRDEGFDGEEGKKSGGKIESKHYHRSERRERGEKDERERKNSRSERLVDGVGDNGGGEGGKKQGSSVEDHGANLGVGNTGSDFKVLEDFRKPDSVRELDRRTRGKRDGSGDGDKHQDGVRELEDKKLSSRDDIARSGRYKDERHKDERVRDKYREDTERVNSLLDEKQKDSWPSRDYTGGRSDDKLVRDQTKDLDTSQKKSKVHHNEYDLERERDREREQERERDRNHDRDRNRDRDRGRLDHDRDPDRDHDDRDNEFDRDRNRDRDLERGYDRDRELDRDRDRGRDHYRCERDRDRIRDRDHNNDRGRDRGYDHDYGSYVDDKGSRYKEDRRRRRSPDGYDVYCGNKERSLSRKAHVDSVTSSGRRRSSPNARLYVGPDRYRDGNQDEINHGDSLRDGASIPEAGDKVPKYLSGEKRAKFDNNHLVELPERSPSTKASPAGLKERSPSSTSVDLRFRTGRRRSLDVDEAERRSSGSNDIRDALFNEDRQGRKFSAKKPLGEDYPAAESLYHHKSSQGNISSHGHSHGPGPGPGPGPGLGPGPSGFRAGADSPSFVGSMGEENRGHLGSRYRRSADPNLGRGPGSAWKGVPNWSSPVPNGFMSFPPGPPGPHHGGFPPMGSQFPPLFGVRPSLEMNHPGIPYHMVDADRFPGHVRPMGWPNIVDGSVPPHFHGWDGNNSVLRDESAMYGPGNLSSARARNVNADMWKPNGDVNMDVTSGPQKDAPMIKASIDEASPAQGASRPPHESSCLDNQGTSLKKNTSSGLSSAKDIPMSPTIVTTDRTPESSIVDDSGSYLHAYLAKLDISMDLCDQELYNQYISVGVKELTEDVEDVELDYMEEKIGEPDVTSLTTDLKYFSAAKDSIFQRALDLYKNQSTERGRYATSNGKKLHDPGEASQLEVKQILDPNEQVDDHSVKQEDPLLTTLLEVSTICEEGKVPESVSNLEGPNSAPLQSAELTPDGVEGETPVLSVGEMELSASAKLITEIGDEVHFPVKSIAVESNVFAEFVGSDGNIGGAGSASLEPMDVSVSDSVILSHDSVKVCEALMPVSNEPEVNLSRIHDAPESTH